MYQTLSVRPDTSAEKRADSSDKKVQTERFKKRNKKFKSKK
jgi:hypothetical protein